MIFGKFNFFKFPFPLLQFEDNNTFWKDGYKNWDIVYQVPKSVLCIGSIENMGAIIIIILYWITSVDPYGYQWSKTVSFSSSEKSPQTK